MDFLFRYFLALIIIPIPFEIVCLMYDTCRENDNLSSIIAPRNFAKVTRFKEKSQDKMFTLCYFSRSLQKITKCDSSMFNVNLLEANQIDICLAQYLAYLINDLD